MPKFTQLGALRIINPQAWKMEIERAMVACKGRIPDAAEMLNVSTRQLFRWLALDELQSISRVPCGLPRDGKRGPRTKEGAHRAGRPKGSKNKPKPDVVVMPSGKKVRVTDSGIKLIPSRSKMKKRKAAVIENGS